MDFSEQEEEMADVPFLSVETVPDFLFFFFF